MYDQNDALQRDIRERLGDDFAWSILGSVGYGVTAVDKNGRFIYVNPAFVQMLGYAYEEIIGKTPYAFTHLEDVDELNKAAQKRSRMQSNTYETRLIHKDGTVVFVQVTGVPELQNEFIGSVAIIANITEKREAEIREQKQRDLADALQSTATKLNSTLELEELFDHILENMEKVVPHDGASILLIEDGVANAVRLAVHNQEIPNTELMNALSIPMKSSPLLTSVLDSGNAMIIDDVAADPDWVVRPGFAWIRSFAVAPILSDGQKIGFLAVFSAQTEYFLEEHAYGLQAFADQAGLAVKNARLFNRTKIRAQRLMWVNEMSVSMNLKRDINEIVQVATEGLVFALDVDQVALAMFNPQDKHLTIVADNPAPGSPSLRGQRIPLQENMYMRELLTTGEPIASYDAFNDHRFEGIRPLMEVRKVKSILLAPLIVHDQIIGSISFDMTHHKRHFSEEEKKLAQTFANLIAARLDLAQVLDSERMRRRELEAVQNATLSLATLLHLPDVLEAILKSLASLFATGSTDIFLYEDEQLTFGLGINDSGITTEPYADPRPDGITYRIAQSGEPLFIENSTLHNLYANAPAEWGQFAIAALPLKIGDAVVGVLNVSYLSVHQFEPFEKRMLMLFANQAAIAIHNARLHGQVRAYASQLEEWVADRTQALNDERNRLQIVLDAVGEAIYFTDTNGRIQYANKATEAITGYQGDEFLGELATIWRGKTARKTVEELDGALEQGRNWHGEVVNQHKNGSYYDADLNLNPLQDVDGKHLGYVGVLRDVTSRKELERLKDQFVSRIGHELRTPLTNINMYFELLQRGNPEKQARYMEILQNEMMRLQKLVDGFLELSRLDADFTKPIALIPINMHLIVNNVVENWQETAVQKGITLELDEIRPLPFALASPEILHDALSPIIENAIQYAPENGRIQIGITPKTKQGHEWLVCEIVDDGPGIPDEELARIFDRFFRGEVTNDYKTAGVGLGLAISQANIHKLGGMIQVEAGAAGGTLFSVWVRTA